MAEIVGFRNEGNSSVDEKIRRVWNQFYSKPEEDIGFPTIVSSTPKSWVGINESDFGDEFYLSEEELSAYVEGFMDVIKRRGNGVALELDTTNTDDVSFEDSALEDDDIKLSMYRSFRSLYDKWMASSSVNDNELKMFYNVEGGAGNRLLYDHFNFVNRGYSNIGNEAVIDITFVEKLVDNPTMSLYETVTGLLSKSNFDFFPLPSYINYNSPTFNQGEPYTELKSMFKAIDNLNEIESSPSFICMFVGGSSRTLDIPKNVETNCDNGGLSFDYGDDSFDITNNLSVSKDIKDGVSATAFKVAYGQDNQSHFKSIQLDQAEYKETQESLLVMDQLIKPKGGQGPTKASKGNNLYYVHLTRSYTCTVESLGNMMIQPLMYFKLENVPLFHGTYLITEVKHNVKPGNVSTTFKGTRQPLVTVPIITDALSLLNLSDTELSSSNSGQSLDELSGGGTDNIKATGSAGSVDNDGTTRGSTKKQTPKIKQYSNWIDCPIDQRIPESGVSDGSKPKGLIAQQPSKNVKYGMREVITTIQNVAEKFNEYAKNKSFGENLYYNDVSLRGGGVLTSHKSHQIGIDMDFRQIRSDKKVGIFPSTLFNGVSDSDTRSEFNGYSREGTRNLIKLLLGIRFRGDGGGAKLLTQIDKIFFNDPVLVKEFPGVVKLAGHSNHIHLKFKVPTRVEEESSKPGTLNSKPFTS